MQVKINNGSLVKILIAVAVSCGILAYITPAHVMADSLIGNRFACVDGTDKLTITKNTTAHSVTVKCASGAQIDYVLTHGPYSKVIELDATCPGSEKPGPIYANPNALNDSGVYYCYNVQGGTSGTATKTANMPVLKQGTNVILCSDNATTVTDISKCPNLSGGSVNLGDASGKYSCGGQGNTISTTINFGCRQQGNAIADLLFGIIRFLSTGVGIVLVGSMVWAGIQFTTSRGDPQATAQAITRVRSNVIALLIFIFAYAILNYVVPGAIL